MMASGCAALLFLAAAATRALLAFSAPLSSPAPAAVADAATAAVAQSAAQADEVTCAPAPVAAVPAADVRAEIVFLAASAEVASADESSKEHLKKGKKLRKNVRCEYTIDVASYPD